MRPLRTLALAVVLTLISLACGSSGTASPTPSPRPPLGPTVASGEIAPDGEPFALTVGADAILDQSGFRVHFDKVTQDTRCFSMECVSIGAATVSLQITESPGVSEQQHTFSIGHPKIAPSSRAIGDYEIEFLDLVPHPGEPPTPKIATLVVRSR